MTKFHGAGLLFGLAMAAMMLKIKSNAPVPVEQLVSKHDATESIEKPERAVLDETNVEVFVNAKGRNPEPLTPDEESELVQRFTEVRDGQLAQLMDAVFDSERLGGVLKAIGDQFRFRENSRALAAETSANQFFDSHYRGHLSALDLSPQQAEATRQVILDDIKRQAELVTLWTDREIDFIEYRKMSKDLPSLNERLSQVLSESDLGQLNSKLFADARERGFSPELLAVREETRRGSLYPLVQTGDTEALTAYLDAGADPNEKRIGDSDTSLLSLAISVGSEEAVATLISHGADVGFVHEDGDTLLHRAATKGTVAIAERLISSGVDVTARNQMGLTPRMTAIVAGLRHRGDSHQRIQELVERVESIE